MTGPLVVVVAGIFTAWIAYTRADPLVTEDYYRKGLQAGHTLASNERAVKLGLLSKMKFAHDRVGIALASTDTKFAPPSVLRVTLSHPTRAGMDQLSLLELKAGAYEGALRIPQAGHWLLLIEDDLQTWRLLGKVFLPTDTEITLSAIQ